MTLEENVSLKKLTTFHVGGPARYFVRAKTLDDVREALSLAEEKGVPFFLLGGGSNVLFSDTGFPGVVLKMEHRELHVDHRDITAGCGALMKLFALRAAREGLTGVEHIAGIPGTVGGAVRGNAGSFGVETKDHLSRVRVLHRTSHDWEEEDHAATDFTFSYRMSTFKQGPSYIIWEATFRLTEGRKEESEQAIQEDAATRTRIQPYEFPSMGSVFKNPSNEQRAGALIEQAGLKGVSVGGAQVSEKHANFIVNKGNATASDAMELLRRIKTAVYETAGVDLQEEIVVLA